MVKFQYISDIHLEHHKNNNVFFKIKKIPGCENICILGDIGYPESQIYKDFMTYCSNTWKNVFWIMGNHEFYNKPKTEIMVMAEIEEYVKQICPKNVYYMNNTVLYLDKITNEISSSIKNNEKTLKIIGSTLWTNINDSTAEHLNDYKKIYSENVENNFGINMYRKLKPQITRKIFQTAKLFILENINNTINPITGISIENIECLILTHHGIHPLCQGNYIDNPLESGYATEIVEIFESKNVVAAICGHIHSNINIKVADVKLLSNCYGYIGENQNIVKFNPKAVLEIIN